MAGGTVSWDIIARDRASAAFSAVGNSAKSAGDRASGAMRLMGAAAVGVGLGLGGLAAAAITTGVKTAAANQQAQISFTSLLGSSQKAGAFLKELTSFAAATPFDLPGVEKAAQQLLGVGLQAQQVKPFLTAFGDTAGALGLQTEQFNSVMTQTTQAIANGRFQVGDLTALASNGIPVYKLLGEAFGKTSAQISDMAKHGKLTADTVLPVLQKQMEKDYGGSMAKQSQTLVGLWSTLKDTFSQSMAQAIMPLIPILGKVLPAAIAAIGPAAAGFGRVMAGVIGGVVNLAGRLGPTIRRIIDSVKVFIAGFTGGTWSTGVGKATGPIVTFGQRARAAFDNLLATARRVWPQIKNGAETAFRVLAPIVMQVFAAITSAIPTVVTAVQTILPYVKDLVSFFQGSVLPAVQPVITAITAGFTALQPVIRGVFDAIRVARPWIEALGAAVLGAVAAVYAYNAVMVVARAAQTAWLIATNIGKIATLAWSVAQWALNAAFAANPIGIIILGVAALVAGLIVAYKQSETFRNIVNGVWSVLRTVVVAAVNAIRNGVVAAWNFMKTTTTAVWNAIKTGVSAAVNAVKTVIVTVFIAVKAAVTLYLNAWKLIFTTVWNAIKAIVSVAIGVVKTDIGLLSSIGSTIRGFFETARTAVSDKIGAVVSLVKGLPGKVTSALGNLGSLLKNAGENVIQGLIDGINNKISAVTGAISKVASAIKSHLPFSPVREGPLATHGGYAMAYSGGQIVAQLADGIAGNLGHLRAVMAGVGSEVAGVGAGFGGLGSTAGRVAGRGGGGMMTVRIDDDSAKRIGAAVPAAKSFTYHGTQPEATIRPAVALATTVWEW